jgi:hypothetical protein
MPGDQYRIRIHQAGTAVTDQLVVNELMREAPKAFRKAQDVLVAAEKYANKSGFFSSERSRLQKLKNECYELSRALAADGFLASQHSRNELSVLIEFLSRFSDAFPNWQKEYDILNRHIPTFYHGLL